MKTSNQKSIHMSEYQHICINARNKYNKHNQRNINIYEQISPHMNKYNKSVQVSPHMHKHEQISTHLYKKNITNEWI